MDKSIADGAFKKLSSHVCKSKFSQFTIIVILNYG